MLKRRAIRTSKSKDGWYKSGCRYHFDLPLSRTAAEALVIDKAAVASHHFLPFLSFMKIERRFRVGANGKPRAKVKKRLLAYAANKDSYIFAYYASILNAYYETYISKYGLNAAVVGYRPKMSNISIAHETFDVIQAFGQCVVQCFDIKSFFDNINHVVLKMNWIKVLGSSTLPLDHFKVFKALTRTPFISLDACIERLGYPSRKSMAHLPKPLCTPREFRDKICGNNHTHSSLLGSPRTIGIPQGSPISAVAANIAMIEFDAVINKLVESLGGIYRRYSDDILIVSKPCHALQIEKRLLLELQYKTRSLALSIAKTSRVSFSGGSARVKGAPLQYLGFTFDGRNRALRPGTIGRYYSRMVRAAAWAKFRCRPEIITERGGRLQLYKRELNAGYTHLGVDTFITGYARRSEQQIGGKSIIKAQIGRHQRVLKKVLKFKRRDIRDL